jgi:hypothetical protein
MVRLASESGGSMSGPSKFVLVLLLIAALMATILIWLVPDRPTPEIWAWRCGLTLSAFFLLGLLVWSLARRDLEPDFLRKLPGRPFERRGVCFSIVPMVHGNLTYLNIAFQNQYSGACEFRVAVLPPARFLRPGESKFPGVDVVVPCAGGMLGVIHTPIGVPARFQNKRHHFRVAAETKYPLGRGRLLRFQNGTAVGKIEHSRWMPHIVTIFLFFLFHIHLAYRRYMTLPIRFSGRLAEAVPSELDPTVETLWLPGEPTDRVLAELASTLERGEPLTSPLPIE